MAPASSSSSPPDPLTTPSAPWRLVGEVVLSWIPGPAVRPWRRLLPDGVRALPGPAALVGVSYSDSPVGPYLELSLALPARLGLRPGLCVVFQVVSSPSARVAYRSNWGLPASVGALSWSVSPEDGAREVRCSAASSSSSSSTSLSSSSLSLSLRGVGVGPAFPAVVPVRSVQRRVDGPVVLPRRFLSLVRLARTTVAVDAIGGSGEVAPQSSSFEPSGWGPPLPSFAPLAGVHPGAVMSGARILARPARHPFGLWSSLRAPLVVPEAALAVGAALDPRYSGGPHRALSSVG